MDAKGRGFSPSATPLDKPLTFRWKKSGGLRIGSYLPTVASVRVMRNVSNDVEQSTAARLALGPGGERVQANRLFRPLYLVSDVLLDSRLVLSLSGDMTARIWSGPDTNSTLLAECGQAVTNGVSVINGQVADFATHGQVTEVWLQVLAPGTGAVSYGFAGKGAADGITFTDTLPITAYRDKLKVQVMAENGYSAGNSTGDAVNPNINWNAFNVNAIMTNVAAFYADPGRGCGIDIEWGVTPFDMPATTLDDGSVTNFYKHTGEIEYFGSPAFLDGQAISNGKMWIYNDRKLQNDDFDLYDKTFGPDFSPAKFIEKNRDDTELKEFVKMVLPSRIGIRRANGEYRMHPDGHAYSYVSDPNVAFQGARLDVVNISEENYLNNGAHYPSATFIQVMEYAIAHELFHLIGGRHGAIPPPNPDGTPALSQSFHPLSEIRVSPAELLQIDLPNRASVFK